MRNNKYPALRQKITNEITLYGCCFLFFALFLGTFVFYERLILGAHAISYGHYGYAILEALILAKIVLIGHSMGIGKRYENRPLIIPVLYKTFTFSLLVLLFEILERCLFAYLEGADRLKIFQFFMTLGIDIMVAKLLIMFFVFLLFFAFLELNRVLGQNRLLQLFFKHGNL